MRHYFECRLPVELLVGIFSRLPLVGACEGLVCMRLRNEEELQISDVDGPRALREKS